MSNNNKVIIAYLYTKFDIKENLINFINHYQKNSPGYDHILVICYKLLETSQVNSLRSITKRVAHIEYIDPFRDNDFDFGSYKRIAEKYPNSPIFFTLGHSYPVSQNWLNKLMNHFDKKTLVGTSASYESIFSSFLSKKKFKILFNFKKFFFLKKNFPNFPNPHMRTINFMLYGSDYLEFISDKSFINKKDAWICESGFNSLTNYFKLKNYNIYVVNSDNDAFSIKDFKLSNTYCFSNQSKQLFSDKHSRKYDAANDSDKIKISSTVWGLN
jgi:hypothetical protein